MSDHLEPPRNGELHAPPLVPALLVEPANGTASGAASPVGEVIESSTVDYLAQACQLHAAPPFGAFVTVRPADQLTVYGVVAHVQTTGLDPGARPIMRGHDHVRDDLIYAENPDLPHVLRTTFRVLVVGYEQAGTCQQVLPSHPPRLHYSVHSATAAEVRRFTDDGLSYLGTLLAASETPTDQLLAASIRLTAAIRDEPADFPRRAGRELAQLLRADYARLASVLRQIVPRA